MRLFLNPPVRDSKLIEADCEKSLALYHSATSRNWIKRSGSVNSGLAVNQTRDRGFIVYKGFNTIINR